MPLFCSLPHRLLPPRCPTVLPPPCWPHGACGLVQVEDEAREEGGGVGRLPPVQDLAAVLPQRRLIAAGDHPPHGRAARPGGTVQLCHICVMFVLSNVAFRTIRHDAFPPNGYVAARIFHRRIAMTSPQAHGRSTTAASGAVAGSARSTWLHCSTWTFPAHTRPVVECTL